MIRSMTGFGKAEFIENGTKVDVEVHSVNGRFLDIKLKLPRILYAHEGELRNIVRKYIDRGRVSITLSIDQHSVRINNMNVDFDLAEKYVLLAEEISKRCNISARIDARALFSMPDILKSGEDEIDAATIWDITVKAIKAALESHKNMREQEGFTIGVDIAERIAVIKAYIEDIVNMIPKVIENNTVRLRKKIETLIDSEKFDENRLAMEVAIYADRVDITEECVRFASHRNIFDKEITGDKTSGKKLSFLIQEMNREVNTIASKAGNAQISQLAVKIKEELEKMREQAENME